MSDLLCDMCHRMVELHTSYLVKIEVLAEPSVPEVTAEEFASIDYRDEIRKLLASMKDASPRELQDGVYRRFQFRLCPGCQRRYLENPLPSD